MPDTPDTSWSGAHAGAVSHPGLAFPVSRHTDPVSVRVGSRATVRRLVVQDGQTVINPTTGRPLVSDVIGVITSVDPLVLVDKHGDSHEIPADQVVVLKTLASRPVRTSDIRAVEQATAAAFPGIANETVDGWLLRAGDGITERSNSAVPLGPSTGTTPVPMVAIRDFYARHDLPVRLLVPDRVARPAEQLKGEHGPEIIVMTRDLDGDLPELPDIPALAGRSVEFSIAGDPDDDWLSLYHFRGEPLPEHALRLLAGRIDGTLGFARITVDGELVAVTRGTVTRGGTHDYLGFSAVEVAADWRRKGLGRYMVTAMLHWGRDHGASRSYLQVITSNTAGRALYHSLGFSEHHRHRCVTLRNQETDML
ncbi:MAG: GNAT family N-acetyltransferase [Corynebacterium sp.]|uniref:N-acetylglutamate synthase, CG3035 family n=1 Tax=Corynebacterium sp. TaxID=1720 RepID=UPI0026495FA8|nr:GNAT family N-acetyltransferase [Corynebacterium sp.]MDN5722599.1 GNAT family N-acetyltransferase [Corynebacterium sp.]MDN6282070.1 GNAT family N-acetyltransferase [Corynebacterium sp.]MDN6304391.1 GNAT family N-acetyltransferase [Corynebacterium sp.]MDN6352389.1 GNAT family N-acetyltransferase [Corynebacterium sp.]MDN6366479.1 GNAT family N-acetyltransferase [Corynebacterium sp.]